MGGKRDDGVVGKIKAGSPGIWYLGIYSVQPWNGISTQVLMQTLLITYYDYVPTNKPPSPQHTITSHTLPTLLSDKGRVSFMMPEEILSGFSLP